MVAGGSKHAADLMVAAFVQGDEGFLFTDLFKACRQQRFAVVVENQFAGGEEFLFVPFEWSVEGGVVDFETVRLGVDDFVEELAVIGEQEQPCGVFVESADRIDARLAMSEAFRKKVIDDGAWIFGAAGVAIGFVESDDKRADGIEDFITKTNLVVRGKIFCREFFALVVGDGAHADELLDFFARSVSEVGEEFDEFHRAVDWSMVMS